MHIRVQQRTGRKSITTVSGLPALNFKKLISEIKKRFACNGSIQDDKEHGTVLQLQGDQRDSIQRFLVEENIVGQDMIRVHGF